MKDSCFFMTSDFKQDGVMIPFDVDTNEKHTLKQVGRKFVFSINGVNPEDAGLYQVEVDGVKIFSTDLKCKMTNQINLLQYLTCTAINRHIDPVV